MNQQEARTIEAEFSKLTFEPDEDGYHTEAVTDVFKRLRDRADRRLDHTDVKFEHWDVGRSIARLFTDPEWMIRNVVSNGIQDIDALLGVVHWKPGKRDGRDVIALVVTGVGDDVLFSAVGIVGNNDTLTISRRTDGLPPEEEEL